MTAAIVASAPGAGVRLTVGQTDGVELTSQLVAPCSPDDLFRAVDDLGAYPAWLSIVPRAETDDGAPGDAGPAWSVDLRGRLGPLARSKRLRMVRTVHDSPRHVRFERAELDRRTHAAWVLDARVEADGDGSRLIMALHYGGSFGGAVLERMLTDEIERSRPRLLALGAPG